MRLLVVIGMIVCYLNGQYFKEGVEKDEQVSHARYVGADGIYVKQMLKLFH